MSRPIKETTLSFIKPNLPLYILVGLIFSFAFWSLLLGPWFGNSHTADATFVFGDKIAIDDGSVISVPATTKMHMIYANGGYAVMFTSTTASDNVAVYAMESNDGVAWDTPTKVYDEVSVAGSNHKFKGFAYGGVDGSRYYAMVARQPNGAGGNIQVSTSSNASDWSDVEDVTAVGAEGAEDSVVVDIATTSNMMAAAYVHNRNVTVATSSDLGLTWTSSTVANVHFTAGDNGGFEASVVDMRVHGASGNEQIELVYSIASSTFGSEFLYASSSDAGVTWATTTISGRIASGSAFLNGISENAAAVWDDDTGLAYVFFSELVSLDVGNLSVTNTAVLATQNPNGTFTTSSLLDGVTHTATGGQVTHAGDATNIDGEGYLFAYLGRDGGLDYALSTSTATTGTISSESIASTAGVSIAHDGCHTAAIYENSNRLKFVTSSMPTEECPSISSFIPPNNQSVVPTDTFLRVQFDVSLDQTMGTTSFKLQANAGNTQTGDPTGDNLCEAVSFSTLTNPNDSIECDHLSDGVGLTTSTWYSASFDTDIETFDGIRYPQTTRYVFQTGSFSFDSNTTPPNITNMSPLMGTQDFPTNGNIEIQFSHDMNTTTASVLSTDNVTLKTTTNGVGSGSNICASSGCTLTFSTSTKKLKVNPTSNLTASTEYELSISSNVKDTNGNNLSVGGSSFVLLFKTGAGADSTAPTVLDIHPASSTVDVALNIPKVSIFFSEEMDESTFDNGDIRFFPDDDAANFTFNAAGETLPTGSTTFKYNPTEKALHIGFSGLLLDANTRYCVDLSTSVTDLVGNSMSFTTVGNDGVYCFTTTAASYSAVPPTLANVDADNFRVWVEFDQPVDLATALTGGNYTIESPLGVQVGTSNANFAYRPEANSVEITNVGLTTDQVYKVTVQNIKDVGGVTTTYADGVGNIGSGTVLNAASTNGLIGGFDKPAFSTKNFATFWEKPERCGSRNKIAGASTTIECEFPAPGSMAVGSSIVLTMPAGYDIEYATVISSSTSFLNADINGPAPGVMYITDIVTNTLSNTITLTTGGDTILSGEQLRFELDNIANPSADGQKTVSVQVKDASNVKLGQTIYAAPVAIGAAGSRSISGTVCKGASATSTCNVAGADTAIASAKVFCDSIGMFSGGVAGHQEATTDSNGDWSISNLNDGEYMCALEQNATLFADTSGAVEVRRIRVSGGSVTGVDFRSTDVSSSGKTLSITITGDSDLASKEVDVFCHAASSDVFFAAPIMKVLTLDANGDQTTSMKLQPNKTYQCSMGPHLDFSAFSKGAVPPVPTFDFMIPRPIEVNVGTTNPDAITFDLESAGQTIYGTVIDASSTGVTNVYVNAAPLSCYDLTNGAEKECFGSFTKTTSTGGFLLNVSPGSYELVADAPGVAPSEQIVVEVIAGGTVKKDGTEITEANPLQITLTKGSLTISGAVKDEQGNGIKYAHVNIQEVASGGTCTSFTPTGVYRDTPTDSSGNYTGYVPKAALYRVSAFSHSYGEVGCKMVTVPASTSQTGQDIQATASDFNTVSGSAEPGAFISVYGANGGNGTIVESDGTYSLNVPSGTVTVECFLHGLGPCGKSTSVDASSDATVSFGTSAATGTVQVTISGITDAYVDLRDSTGVGYGTGQNDDGVYTLTAVEGSYTLRAGGPQYGELCTPQSVTVSAATPVTVTCTAPTVYTVAGRVTDGSDNLAGVTMKLIKDATGESFIVNSDGATTTNNNFSFSGVPAGTYSLKGSKAGYEQNSGSVTVSADSLSNSLALTQASGSNGATVTIPIQDSSDVQYAGNARVIATKDSSTIVADMDKTDGNAEIALTNGTWTVKVIGDNGYESDTTSVTVSGGSLSGSAPTLGLDNAISGFTLSHENKTVTPKSGGLITSDDVDGLEVNVPASTLSTSDSNTGKIEIKTDPTIAGVEPGEDLVFVGSTGYDITPKDSGGNTLGKTLYGDAVTITLPYTDADVADLDDETKLVVASLNANGEFETFPSVVDTTNNLVIAQVTHFSSFGILGGDDESSSGSSPTVNNNTVNNGGGGGGGSHYGSGKKPPTVAEGVDGFTINQDADSTDSREVTLYFDVNKATQVAVSNSSDFSGAAYETYSETMSWTLSEGDGTKKVYVRLRSSAGGYITLSDTIALTGQGFDQPVSEAVEADCALEPRTVHKYNNSPAVYYITPECTKRPFKNPHTYFTYFTSWDAVQTSATADLNAVGEDTLGFMPWGPLYDPQYGAIVKHPFDPKVYLLLNDRKYWIETADVFEALYGKTGWGWIEDVDPDLLDNYEDGSVIDYTDHHPNYTIIKYANDRKVYRLEPPVGDRSKQVKRHIKNPEVFEKLKFRWDRIVVISDDEVYEDGPEIE